MDRTVDEGTDTSTIDEIYLGRFSEHQEPDIDVGDEYGAENIIVVEVTKYNVLSVPVPFVGTMEFADWKIKIEKTIHNPIIINYWNVYNYSFLNWNYLREERRAA